MANKSSIGAKLQAAREKLTKGLYHDVLDDLGRIFPMEEKEELMSLMFEAIDGLLEVDRAHSYKTLIDHFHTFETVFGVVSSPLLPREEVIKRAEEALMSGEDYETLSSLASLYKFDDKLRTFHWDTVNVMMPNFIQKNKGLVYTCLMENKRLITHICNGADQKCVTCLVMKISGDYPGQ